MPTGKVKISCLQFEIVKGDHEANLKSLEKFAALAHEDGADLLVLPEMWTSGFAYRQIPRIARETPSILKKIGRLAQQYGLAVAGSMPEMENDELFNTLFVVDMNGTVRAAYRKIHLFPSFKEDIFIAAGRKLVNTRLLGMNVGLSICFDLRFPELFRKLALKGARLIVVSAQWPEERIDHWRTLVTARAVENQIFIAAVNASGRTGKTVFGGHSMIVGPTGRILAEGGDGEELVAAAIDPDDVEASRKTINYLNCRVKDADEFLTNL